MNAIHGRMIPLAAFLLLAVPAGRAAADAVLLLATRPVTNAAVATNALRETLAVPVNFPGEANVFLHAPAATPWATLGKIELAIGWPAGAATNAQVLLHVKDWDCLWYQKLLPGYLEPGKINALKADISPEAEGWRAVGHHSAWNLTALAVPMEVGVRLFCEDACVATARIERATGVPRRDAGPPAIGRVLIEGGPVYCGEKFEARFRLPDRYENPFDPEAIRVTGCFTAEGGSPVTVDGFYGRDYYRQVGVNGEVTLPQGAPYWCVRFAPRIPGPHTFTLRAEDARGRADWGPAVFEALPPRTPGFVRVSRRDPRYFEFDNGEPYFPLGHNTRSPFDTRHDEQFPWKQRWPEGTAAYYRYFADMSRHGENWAEIWCAAWSLGLEWSPLWRGYHGIGQYNTMNAWELDRVVEMAEAHRMRLNVVIHNHGKFGLKSDKEWSFNPFNVQMGGYLEKPEEYFTDPRAMQDFRKLMRYTIARWGHSASIFAWELWSEHNLCGSGGDFHKQPEVVEWHRLMGAAIKEMDPYDHLVSTHVSGDYGTQHTNTIALREMDLCPVDAYHNSPDPLFIVDLMRRTAEFNNPFGKPVLITEFGGSSRAANLKHLDATLHAALWASTCIPLGGGPMFWWWSLIEEENFYPEFLAVSRFMAGEDRRDPEMVMRACDVSANGEAVTDLQAHCLGGARRALGWAHIVARFDEIDPRGKAVRRDVAVKTRGLTPGAYTVEFWDTSDGRPVSSTRADADAAGITFVLPPFARDVAFKIRP